MGYQEDREQINLYKENFRSIIDDILMDRTLIEINEISIAIVEAAIELNISIFGSDLTKKMLSNVTRGAENN